MSASAIYEGVVRHRRFEVRHREPHHREPHHHELRHHELRHHELRHRLALAYIDLDELPDLLGGRLLARRPGLMRFRRGDYLGDPAIPLADAVRETVHAQTGARPEGPIRVLTHLRTFGHCFNPVSFYYCLDPAGEHVQCVLAEVTNTPWGERHAYVLAPDPCDPTRGADPCDPTRGADPCDPTRGAEPSDPTRGADTRDPARAAGPGAVLGGSVSKALHVSPFMGMDHRYEWRLTAPAQTLSVHIASRREGRLVFDATLSLRRGELTRASLGGVTARYPFATLRVLALIYAHGVALKLRGVPVHRHPRAA